MLLIVELTSERSPSCVLCLLKNIEVIAFEPNPDSFNYLKKNADRFGKIQAVNKAVDVKDGTLICTFPGKVTGRADGLLYPTRMIM
jgi:FkbM family methyltransferase